VLTAAFNSSPRVELEGFESALFQAKFDDWLASDSNGSGPDVDTVQVQAIQEVCILLAGPYFSSVTSDSELFFFIAVGRARGWHGRDCR
jgi:hypothetical protein